MSFTIQAKPPNLPTTYLSAADPPFTRNYPDLVQNLISSFFDAHAAAAPGNRERLVRQASRSIECENHVRELRTFFTLSQSHASRVLLL